MVLQGRDILKYLHPAMALSNQVQIHGGAGRPWPLSNGTIFCNKELYYEICYMKKTNGHLIQFIVFFMQQL